MNKKMDQKLCTDIFVLDTVLSGGIRPDAFRRWLYSLPTDPVQAGKSTLGLRLMQRRA